MSDKTGKKKLSGWKNQQNRKKKEEEAKKSASFMTGYVVTGTGINQL